MAGNPGIFNVWAELDQQLAEAPPVHRRVGQPTDIPKLVTLPAAPAIQPPPPAMPPPPPAIQPPPPAMPPPPPAMLRPPPPVHHP